MPGRLIGAVTTAARVAAATTAVAARTATTLRLRLWRHRLVDEVEHLGRRTEPQRRRRDLDHVVNTLHLNLERRGRHARLQAEVRVVHIDDRFVGHDVLRVLRVEAHLLDRAVERDGAGFTDRTIARGGDADMFNGVELELTWEDLDALEEDIESSNLPHTSGFFFGDPADQHYYEQDLEFIKNARAELFLGFQVFYNSSW